MEVNKINIKNSEELSSFYGIGKEIHDRNAPEGIPWSEDYYLDELLTYPEFEVQLFTANNGTNKGRVAVMRYINDPKTGVIGWYQCDADQEISDTLLNAAVSACRKMGCTSVIGPMNGNTWHHYRFNINSEVPLLPGDPYNPQYYVDFWKKFGFKTFKNYLSSIADKDHFVPMSIEDGKKLADQYQLEVDFFPKNLDDETLGKLYDFYNICFQGNPLFTKISKDAYRDITSKAAQILNYEHSLLIKDKKGFPVAVLLSYHDVYYEAYKKGSVKAPEHAHKKLLIKTIATHPNWQNKKIGTLMVNFIYNRAHENNYDEIFHLLMYQNNISAKKGEEKFTTQNSRRYELFKMDLKG